MKLKLYHVITLTLLILLSLGEGTLFGFTIYHFCNKGSQIADGVIYVLCFILILAFTILEIVNTIFSFKDGSRFVKFLVYDDQNVFVNGVFIVACIFLGLGLALDIYCICIFSGLKVLFSDLDIPMIYIAFLFGALIIINAAVVLLFPLLGKQDKSMKIKKRKKRGYDL